MRKASGVFLLCKFSGKVRLYLRQNLSTFFLNVSAFCLKRRRVLSGTPCFGQLVNWSDVFADPLFYQKKTLLYIIYILYI